MQLRHEGEQLAVPAGLRQRRVSDVIVEVDVRIFFPVERTEATQRAVGHPVRKGFAKLGGRSVGVAKSSHELALVHAWGELEQVHPGHVHRRLGTFQVQEPRVEEFDSVHLGILPDHGVESACPSIGSFINSAVSGILGAGKSRFP